MKNRILSVLTFVTVLLAAALTFGQSNPPPIIPPNYSVPSGYTLVPTGAIVAGQPVSTNSIPTTQSFVQTVESYVTQFNTNLLTFSTNSPFELWTGVGFQQGLSVGALAGFDAKPFHGLPGLYLGDVATFAGVIGTVAADEVDVGYAIVHYDLEVKLFAGAVAQFADDAGDTKGLRGSVGTQWQKAVSDNAFAGIRGEDIFGGPKNELQIALVTGFSF